MRKSVAVSTIVLSTALALSGCMSKQGDVGNKNIRPNSYGMQGQGLNGTRFANDGANERNRIHGTQQMNNNVTGRHGASNLELSQTIANKLAELPEIKSAYVALTNNNAYVAIVERRDAAGARPNAAHRPNAAVRPNSTDPGTTIHPNAAHRTDGTVHPGARARGGVSGVNPYSVAGTEFLATPGTRHHGAGYRSQSVGSAVPRTGMRDGSRYTVNNSGAYGGYSALGTGTGTTGTTGTAGAGGTRHGTGTTGFTPPGAGTTGTTGTHHGAGTAGTGTYGTGTAGASSVEVSDALKNKVADVVKGMAPGVNNVFVSANADFYGRLQSMAADFGRGHPIQGMITEFNALVERIFPQAAGTGTGLHTKTAPSYYPSTTPSRHPGFGTTR
ncbi:YhcN/YlaJ family sporulation lipoprotein [Cohnella xylanilytica]|uniref:YhcN/YlaJ family sporulation lipoprotein n=1 Tax=Cohnella xylanilytica TaxID=557555 RepID=A0A841U815_9BACL|nr:YhcN/YlaJ family sporulation lipoprotein [Cohnella xylanilytica]MBB6694161.1 YhcN/YlaJ family sporulation lipoprotein [Cohnella xylanilytica]